MCKMFWFNGCSNPVDVLFFILLRVRGGGLGGDVQAWALRVCKCTAEKKMNT